MSRRLTSHFVQVVALAGLVAGCGAKQKDATFKVQNPDTYLLVGAAVLGMMQQGYEYTIDPATGRVSSPMLFAGSQNEVQYNIVATPLEKELEITTTVVDANGNIDKHVPAYTAKFKRLVDDIIHFMDASALAETAKMNRDGTWVKLDGMVRIGQNVESGCESLGTITVPVVKMIAAPMYFKQINFTGIADKLARVITLQKGGNYFQPVAANVNFAPGGFSATADQKLQGTAYRCPEATSDAAKEPAETSPTPATAPTAAE